MSLPPQPLALPPPPSAEQFARLAGKSSASNLLANKFLAAENEPRRQAAAAAAPAPGHTPGQLMGPFHSSTPTYSSTLNGTFRLDQYHPLEEIYGFLEQLARRYPRRVQLFTIGQTAEGRPIRALELKNNASDGDYVWLDALTHAREWITATTMLYTIDQLVAGGRPDAALFAKNYIIIPVVNPDGYAYTWSTNRMWRKNRSRSQGSKCSGADLNRNFDHSFRGEGASAEPCSHIYAGAYPNSEAETRALSELMWSLKDRIKFYLTMHSFNQLWACPYAHTTESSAHLGTHMRVLRQIQQAVYQTEGVHYEIGPLSTSLYVGSGFGIDFAYDKCAIVHSYLVELRDRGQRGFVLPPDEIMPTARETLAGLHAGLRAVFGGL